MTAKLLFVVIEATTEAIVSDMIDQLCRSACDIANSTEDDEAHVIIEGHIYELKGET